MVTLNVVPTKAQFQLEEQVEFKIHVSSDKEIDGVLELKIFHLDKLIYQESKKCLTKANNNSEFFWEVILPTKAWTGYGVEVTLIREEKILAKTETAFDKASHWREAPRYGFLSDFNPEEKSQLEDVDWLNELHLNVVQFYDWMYRHDNLLSNEDIYIDPMGRKLSYDVIKEKISALHEKGMSAIAYGAVYAALKDFFDEHQSWGLYKNNGEPFTFIDLFYLMDISPDSPWSRHIINEYSRVIESGFDGIHMDQYGFPKVALRKNQSELEVVDMAEQYCYLINETKKTLVEVNENAGVIFNNVSNYPTFATSKTDQDAIYIEVWNPYKDYRHLQQLILEAKSYNHNKNVILAGYMPCFIEDKDFNENSAESALLLTMSTIFANGGYHLAMGENAGVLTDAYYPDYGRLSKSLQSHVKRYYDFIVRYGNLLYDQQFDNITYSCFGDDFDLSHENVSFSPDGEAGKVWYIIFKNSKGILIHLINLSSCENVEWKTGKDCPEMIDNIVCEILWNDNYESIYFASPNNECIELQEIDYKEVTHPLGTRARIQIPSLHYWNMIWIKTSDR